MLDLTKRLLFEWRMGDGWAPDTLPTLQKLGISQPEFPVTLSREPQANVERLLVHSVACEQQFGRDLLADVDPAAPHFYSNFDWKAFLERIDGVPGVTGNIFDEPEFLFFPGRQEA
jgi:hypothetical protein